jgi:hypothetical protein
VIELIKFQEMVSLVSELKKLVEQMDDKQLELDIQNLEKLQKLVNKYPLTVQRFLKSSPSGYADTISDIRYSGVKN